MVCLYRILFFHSSVSEHLGCFYSLAVVKNTTFALYIHVQFFKKRFCFFFRKRRREGEREGEKYQCVVVSHIPPAGDLVHNPNMCPDWDSNRDPVVRRPALCL